MQLWSIAAREGQVWELLLKIISGQVAQPVLQKATTSRKTGKTAVKAMKSAHLFVNIGGIEDSVLEGLLNDVVIGHGTLQHLNEQCAMVKARMKVQSAVLQHVDMKETDWEVGSRIRARSRWPSTMPSWSGGRRHWCVKV